MKKKWRGGIAFARKCVGKLHSGFFFLLSAVGIRDSGSREQGEMYEGMKARKEESENIVNSI